MPVLRFRAEDVRRVVKHSIAALRQSDVAYTTKPVEAPAVLLVHEQGVYLMSNGDPRDIVGADAADRSFCAYAIGCHPEKARKLKALIDGGARIITLRMT